MKKVLFSSVCAVALLGINAYAEPTTVITSSLEDFLTQKKDLENKINVQNTLITQKKESINTANTTYQEKDTAYKEASKNINNAILTAGDKEGLKNTAEREHASLVNQGNLLTTQKDNLNSQLQGINDLITKQDASIKSLTEQIATSKTNLYAKEKVYNDLVAQLKPLNEEHIKLVTAENEALKTHQQALDAYNANMDDESLKTKLDDAKKKLDEAHLAVKISDDTLSPLNEKKNAAHFEFMDASKNHNDLVFKQREEEKNLEKYKSNQTLKQQEIQAHEQKIVDNLAKQTQVKTKVDEAMKVYNEALANIETAKQNQANVKVELDTASENLEKAKQDLLTAQANLDELNQKLKDIESNIANNTEEGKKVKEHLMATGIYSANTQTQANALITLAAANNGDLSTATSEVKAQAQVIANEIANTIMEDKKDDITAEALSTLNVQINNMNKRLGEIRGLNGDLGAWFRVYGGRFSNGKNNFNYYSTQIGADKKTNLNFTNADVIAGVMFGYDKINAGVKAKDKSIGAYFSYIHNDGYFADLVLKYIRSSYESKFVDVKSQNSFLLSAEGGYRFNLNNSFYLEPSLEIITGYIGKYESSLKIFNKFKINVDAHSPLIFKPQIFAGYSVNDFTFRAGVGAVIDTQTKEANLLIGDIIKGVTANVKSKLGASDRGFVSLGTAYKFNDNLRLNLSVERSFGSSLTNDYEINSTIRYTF